MSAPEHDAVLAAAQAAVAARRRDYADLRDTLPATLASVIDYADAVADALMSVADEFGANEAVRQLRETPEAFGHPAASLDDDGAQALEDRLDAILDARDRLDDALSRASDAARVIDPDRHRTVHIDGALFAVDADSRLLTSLDAPEQSVPLDGPFKGGRDMTLTEEARYRAGVDPAEPKQPDRARDRSR